MTDSTFTAILGRNASYACRELKWDAALAAAEDTMPKDLTMASKIEVPRARRCRGRGSCRRRRSR